MFVYGNLQKIRNFEKNGTKWGQNVIHGDLYIILLRIGSVVGCCVGASEWLAWWFKLVQYHIGSFSYFLELWKDIVELLLSKLIIIDGLACLQYFFPSCLGLGYFSIGLIFEGLARDEKKKMLKFLLQNVYKLIIQWMELVKFNNLNNECLNYLFVFSDTLICKSYVVKFRKMLKVLKFLLHNLYKLMWQWI